MAGRFEERIVGKLKEIPLLAGAAEFYEKHREVLLYLVFGGITTVLNLGMFFLIDFLTGIGELVNNVFCWTVCVLFQFFTNRTWVFEAKTGTGKGFLRQMAEFFGGRLFTLFLEEAILLVFITWLGFSTVAVKLSAQIVVIVSNYVISKLIVFRKK